MRFSYLLVSFFLVACGSPTSAATDAAWGDTAATDASTRDMRIADIGFGDASSDMAGPTDLSTSVDMGSTPDMVAAAGFGRLSGTCGVLDTELTANETFFFANTLDFANDPYDDADLMRLTEGGQQIIADGNAGGNSLLSEVFAFEVLARCEGATLLKTETQVTYQNSMGKITDLLVELDGLKIGVSVTRAIAFPFDEPYTPEQATTLLTGKLEDIQLSSANVAPADAWNKQILSVIAYSPMHTESLRTAYEGLDSAITADTIVFVTATNGDDAPLY